MLASDEQALGIKPLRMIYSRDFSHIPLDMGMAAENLAIL
jgi:hypothetical protein